MPLLVLITGMAHGDQELYLFRGQGMHVTGGPALGNLWPSKHKTLGTLDDSQYTNYIGKMSAVFTIGLPPSYSPSEKTWMKVAEHTKFEHGNHFSYVVFGPAQFNRNQYFCAVAKTKELSENEIHALGENMGKSFEKAIPLSSQIIKYQWETLQGKEAYLYVFKILSTHQTPEYLVLTYYVVYANDFTVTFCIGIPHGNANNYENHLKELQQWISSFRYNLSN